MKNIELKTGYEFPIVYLIEELIEKHYHPEGRIELLRAMKNNSPEIKVLYANYSQGELIDIIKRKLNLLESERISKEIFSGN